MFKSKSSNPNAALIAALAEFDKKYVSAPRQAHASHAWRHEFEKEIKGLQKEHADAKHALATATTRDDVERYVKSVEGLRREESLRYALSRIPNDSATDMALGELPRITLNLGAIGLLLEKVHKHAVENGNELAAHQAKSFKFWGNDAKGAEKFVREYCAKLTTPAAP
jgi:hypothetical protein